MKVAVIIPTFNEKDNISRLVRTIDKTLKDTEIIVVDDNSPDGTSRVVLPLLKEFPNLYLISRKGKSGRGSAVLEGFKFAQEKLKADVFIEMDADFSHDPQELPKIISLGKKDTVVLASRYIPKSKILNWPPRRIIASRISNLLIKLFLNLPAKDNTNGYRCYPKEAVGLLLKHKFNSTGYILLSETERYLFVNGFRLVEFPSVFRNRKKGKSKSNFREYFLSLYLLFKIRITTNGK